MFQQRVPTFRQAGFVHSLLAIILIIGMIAGIYLVQHPQILKSRAGETTTETTSLGTADYTRIIPQPFKKPIYSYKISGSINLRKSSSYTRAVLIDDKQKEYLIYEAYPLIANTGTFTVTNACEETCVLNGVIPVSLRIEGNNAPFSVSGSSYTTVPPSTTSNLDQQSLDAKLQADNTKITKINAKMATQKPKWTAGVTTISKLTYQQKRQMFHGLPSKPLDHLPNLQGFEYYKRGVFVLPPMDGGPVPTSAVKPSGAVSIDTTVGVAVGYPDKWDYRKFQGENWMTPVKNQLYYETKCGSCWAFAPVGATEALANLYFNRHLDLDLSEQDIVSCSGGGTCKEGTDFEKTLNYFTNTGIATESCFPYKGADLACSNKCSGWQSSVVKISGKTQSNGEEVWIKENLIRKGPLIADIISRDHYIVIVGWDTDPLLGQPVWIFKDSNGTGWGEAGYGRVIGDINRTYAINSPIQITNNPNLQIACVDKDGDGYCNWGISASKPSTCPGSCKAEKDCDDSNPNLTKYNDNFECVSAAPTSTPTSVPTNPPPTPPPTGDPCPGKHLIPEYGGGCDDACCTSVATCTGTKNGQTCTYSNGACQSGISCDDKCPGKKDISPACNSACCDDNSDCVSGSCGTANGYCQSGYSCK